MAYLSHNKNTLYYTVDTDGFDYATWQGAQSVIGSLQRIGYFVDRFSTSLQQCSLLSHSYLEGLGQDIQKGK